MLRAIDIAHPWQDGIDPANVDCDIVIVKASGGTCYTNPKYREWADKALASGKLLAFYHYACELNTAPGGKAEAEYFWERVKDYKGRAVLILDWENYAHNMPVSYAKAFLDRIAELSGSTPFFYDYAGHLNATDYSAIVKYPLWMASYLDRYDGAGWVDNPSNIWSTGDWNDMKMYQYTSTGYISGYSGRLDLSVFYGSKADWIALEGGKVGSIEKMVQHAVSIANNDYYGYSWADRWDHDRDCSSLMYDSADAAGYSVGRGPDKTRYTGTMIDDFCGAGFTKYNFGSVVLKRGDILLRDPWGSGGHTEMYIGNSQTVGAHSAENGGVYGQPGDQTGNEISITAMWGSWDYVLRPPEGSGAMGGWIEKNGKWWYKHDDGSYTTNGWEYIGNHWYWFDSEGWMKTGWLDWNENWYYLQPKTKETGNSFGYMVTGWNRIKWQNKDNWFWFDPNGAMYSDGFIKISGKWYGFDANGVMVDELADMKVSAKGVITFK
jgi:GH25 family lysozyme M1 (1,4-beta-N-acetylmuramidase)